jgi:hypothetical protein
MSFLRVSCVVTAFLAAAVAGAQETYVVSGTVTGPGGPLPGLAVSVEAVHPFDGTILLKTEVATDGTGAFRVTVPRSRVSLSAEPDPSTNLERAFLPPFEVSRDTNVRMTTDRLVTLSGSVIGNSGAARIEIYSLTTNRITHHHLNAPETQFEVKVRRGMYSLRTMAVNNSLAARNNVDAGGDQSGIEIRLRPITEFAPVPALPPRAALISASAPDDDGVATITGAAGAVEPMSSILLGNMATGHVRLTVSRADGSFSATLFAPPGMPIMVRHDPAGRYLPHFDLNSAPATLIYTPLPAGQFSSMGLIGSPPFEASTSIFESMGWIDPGTWHVTGTFSGGAMTPGAPMRASGTLRIYARDVQTAADAAAISVSSALSTHRLIDESGLQQHAGNLFVSTWMTPSGLPVERSMSSESGGPAVVGPLQLIRPGVLEATWSVDATLPLDLPPGVYRTNVSLGATGMPQPARRFDGFPVVRQVKREGYGSTPVIRVGATPMRLAWALGLDQFSNGTRGIVAVEDRGKVGLSSKVTTHSDTFVVPLQGTMRLEPFLPLLSITPGGGLATEASPVAFRLPSGSLTATVRRPDGQTETIGPAPFAQVSFHTPVTRSGESATAASNHSNDFHQLVTLDPRFDYTFTQWGRHVIALTGNVEDIHGNVYEGRGTYEVDVARHLDLDAAVLPGTPFAAGDYFSTGLTVQPAQPAQVSITVRLYPGSSVQNVKTFEIRGAANRFGYFAGTPIRMEEAGEYRVDVRAESVDAAGVRWVGAATWGGIVETPQSRLVTRGRRGFDLSNRIQEQWLFVKQSRTGGDHLMFPFSSGDVMWMSKDDPAADIPKITIQDPDGTFAARVRARSRFVGAQWETPGIEERITAGEIPLFSTASGTGAGYRAAIDQWGYFYAAVSRPGVRVREFISEDRSETGYWRFSDRYNFQLGNGIAGDLPNDFKFQFGGAVYRDLTDGFRYYGGYASLFVLLPMNDETGGRTFPPFQGNGGGPSGGPLFRLKGRDIDLFFHLTSLRPGTVLQTLERASFAGYVAPTLPGAIEIRIISPSGRERVIAGRANRFGYFYDPSGEFTPDEPGVWRAHVRVVFDGIVPSTSGQVTAPFPTGGVLGSREGEFNFYVVDRKAEALEIVPVPETVRPADAAVPFTVNVPPGLREARLTWTTTMPGFILEEGSGGTLTYAYDASRLAGDFPNLDLHDVDGYAGADTITVSLMLSAIDGSGNAQHHARQITLQGEDLYVTAQQPRTTPARRRATHR